MKPPSLVRYSNFALEDTLGMPTTSRKSSVQNTWAFGRLLVALALPRLSELPGRLYLFRLLHILTSIYARELNISAHYRRTVVLS